MKNIFITGSLGFVGSHLAINIEQNPNHSISIIYSNIHYKKTLSEDAVFNQVKSSFPISKQPTNAELSFPIYLKLTENEISFICNKIINFFKSKNLC